MQTYKFTKTDFDAELIVDAIQDHQEFFIVDTLNLEPADIRDGFNYEIEAITKNELILFAEGKGLTLSIYENGDLFEEYMVYGIYNGTTSFLELGSYDISTTGDVYSSSSVDIRFDAAGLAQANTDLAAESYPLISSDDIGTATDLNNAGTYVAGVSLEMDLVGYIGGLVSDFESTYTHTFLVDTWYNLRVDYAFISGSSDLTITFYIDGIEVFSDNTTEALGGFEAGNYFNASYGDPSDPYALADMKNILLTANSGNEILVDIKNPSTGVNDGIGSDATVTDVTQGN